MLIQMGSGKMIIWITFDLKKKTVFLQFKLKNEFKFFLILILLFFF